jgi:hypothetical protein
MKQAITLSEVIRFINNSRYTIHINEIYNEAIEYVFKDLDYTDGGFVRWVEDSVCPHECENYCDGCREENERLESKIDVLKNLFEIDWDWEKEEDYQNYIWEEAKTYCTNPDCHKDSYSKWCCHNDSFINGNVKNCNDIESIIEKEAEEFAQKMYDENDEIQKSLYCSWYNIKSWEIPNK